MRFSKFFLASLVGLTLATPALADSSTERLVRSAKCEALLVSQVKLYRATATFITGSGPVLLDGQTRRSAEALSDGYSRFSDATLRRAAALDDYAKSIAPSDVGYAIYKKAVNVQASAYLKSAADAAIGVLPSPSTIEEMSKEALVCTDWIDSEIVPGQTK